MKAATLPHLVLGLLIVPLILSSLVLAPQQARAQDSAYPATSEAFSREELAQMLAPVALYPDALLSQILMASTYPIEVIEADRWLSDRPGLKGDALDQALLDRDWDPSVKAMCHFPSILALMSERISETTAIGNAFLAQEAEVMNVVQELRARAYAQGNLASDSRQKVIVEKETIIIEPADPRVIYVPYYDPFYVYGPWWYPAYPPWYWGPPGVTLGVGISYWPGFYFSFAFGTWSYFDWPHHYIFINVHKRPRFVRHDRWFAKPGRWHHARHHRRGVAYRDKSTARKYGQHSHRTRDFRRDTRGFPERRDTDHTRSRSTNDRSWAERRRNLGSAIDRTRQAPQRIERDRQVQQRQTRSQTDRTRQEGTTLDRDRQVRQRVERDRQVRERQVRDQVVRDRQKRTRVERARREQPRTGGVRQSPRRSVQPGQVRQRVERERRVRDNVFNRVDDGWRERRSSLRGQTSRQGRGENIRGRGRSDGGNRGRNRR
jgi:hypothetical protein